MRTIEPVGRFTKDFRRIKKGRHSKTIEADLNEIVIKLASDAPLDARLSDHQLTGEWRNHRDCHIKPDLVLIYRKLGSDTLQLVRLGSHAELGW